MITLDLRQMAISLLNKAVEDGTRLFKACTIIGISVRTYKRWCSPGGLNDKRKLVEHEPANKLSQEEYDRVLSTCNSEPYRSLPPSQIVPMLADKGVYIASESTFYRILRKENQLHRRGKVSAPKVVAKPKSFKANAANQVWSWDITYLASSIRGKFYRLYLIMDVFSRKIVGWEVHENETAAHAAVLIQKACLAEQTIEKNLVLHSDNGSPMKGATMLATLQRLGVVPSFSRPSVSDDNPYSESLFKTLKYTPAYPSKPFESLEAARAWVQTFACWYNTEHRHSSLRFVTPEQRHTGADKELLQKRNMVYELAKKQNPKRWSGNTRNWARESVVWLNPEKQVCADLEHSLAAA
jgi:transposase InsO family protein